MRGLLEELGRNPDFIAVALICAALIPMPRIAGWLACEPVRPAVVWHSAPAPKVRIDVPRLRAQAMRDALTAQEQALVLMEQLRAESAACNRKGN